MKRRDNDFKVPLDEEETRKLRMLVVNQLAREVEKKAEVEMKLGWKPEPEMFGPPKHLMKKVEEIYGPPRPLTPWERREKYPRGWLGAKYVQEPAIFALKLWQCAVNRARRIP